MLEFLTSELYCRSLRFEPCEVSCNPASVHWIYVCQGPFICKISSMIPTKLHNILSHSALFFFPQSLKLLLWPISTFYVVVYAVIICASWPVNFTFLSAWCSGLGRSEHGSQFHYTMFKTHDCYVNTWLAEWMFLFGMKYCTI